MVERPTQRVPRRTFLVRSLQGAAAVGAVGTLGRPILGGALNDEISVAVIGTGGMGRAHADRFLPTVPKTRLATVCDVDDVQADKAAGDAEKKTGHRPQTENDFRRVLDDKSIQAVVVATTHHWHAPIAIRAMQAGKDVYVEKPGSHCFREGRLLVEAARKYKRIVQHGTQMRSSDVTKRAAEILASGILGEIRMTKAWNVQGHAEIPPVADEPIPSGVNYDMWLGPAAKRPFNRNRFHGKWNWYREYGNGDIGGDGIHDLDMARFGLGVTTHPVRITAHGSRVALGGERQFPDNMSVAYQYADGRVLLYEDRGFAPYGLHGFDSGNAFYGTEGYMIFTRRGRFWVYMGRKEEKGEHMASDNRGHPDHVHDFIASVRSRKEPIANAEVGHLSCGLVHLGETAYRVGRVLHFDPDREVVKDDPDANALLTKEYRAPWDIPDPV